MCKLTPQEKTILLNLGKSEKGLVATELNISETTIDVHLHRIRRKREECKKFLRETDQYKKELYPKRKGE
jgi:FixJ family two-component response regulator